MELSKQNIREREFHNKLQSGNYDRVVVFEDCEKNIRSLKQTVQQYNSQVNASVEYSAMCILHDQTMVQKESRWRREELLHKPDYRTMTRNFLRKTW